MCLYLSDPSWGPVAWNFERNPLEEYLSPWPSDFYSVSDHIKNQLGITGDIAFTANECQQARAYL